MDLPKAYNPKKVEAKIYALWEKSGFFNPDELPASHKKPFTIVIPPPNVTGSLHMGHALNGIVQDILIRWQRMQCKKTLWLPGTDHAGIATQNVVEKELKKEGLTRHDLGRKKFLERVWQWKEKYGNIILEQFKKLGCSCDWSRTRFTLDKDYIRAVEKAFAIWYKKGWIYKGNRVINWCPRCASTLSDLELTYKEQKGNLWYIRYPLKTKSEKLKTKNKFIVVATTRPETMLGDTAVAVNPKDKRYKALVGKKVLLPLTDREIPIIADKVVDLGFGTGALKVTPGHDLVDFEIGQHHQLPVLKVIDEKSKIIAPAPPVYQELSVKEARQKVVEDLKKRNLLEKIESYEHSVAKCYRCQTTVEPLTSKQWFIKMDELAKLATRAVKSGQVKFHPKRWEKTYFTWLKNIKDWCISRQIWWGHKIPLKGETDVLDTWFSSALWPFATLGWPKKTKDLERFYPTDVLSTDRGIINLWVARMIFSSLDLVGRKPFSDIYIHPTVLTREGKRMSKSLGTGTDPLELIEKYGADATRLGIAWQVMGGQDIRFVEDNMVMGKKFCNKIWNAARFVLQQIGKQKMTTFGCHPERSPDLSRGGVEGSHMLTSADKRILKRLNETIKSTNQDLRKFRFGPAARQLYDFFWHDFCDKYIEKSKLQIARLDSPSRRGRANAKTPAHHASRSDASRQKEKQKTQNILLYVLRASLKLLHPFIPFVTEAIYQKLPLKNKQKCLMIEEWPNSCNM